MKKTRVEKKRVGKTSLWKVAFILILMFLFGIQSLLAVGWSGSIEDFFGDEDSLYLYNVSENLTDIGNNLTLAVDTSTNNITWDNGTSVFNYLSLDSINWFSFDSNNYFLDMNISKDNQTGFFKIPFQANDNETDGITKVLSFTINATNDAPEFTSILDVYNFSQDYEEIYFINASDEEEHYPLKFNISWENNCTHALWSDRNTGENCSLFDFGFDFTNFLNQSAIMNFTSDRNDVGTYWANITVNDSGASFSCPHEYCDNSTYEKDKFTVYPVKFNVFSSLSVNVSDCNKILTEGDNLLCNITITTRGEEDSLNISSDASLLNYEDLSIENNSWFYGDSSMNSSSFIKTLEINVSNLQDKHVGNWSINFTVEDTTFNEIRSSEINIFVNNTQDNVSMDSIPSLREIYENFSFYFNVSDDDLLIPDKNLYNEVINFYTNATSNGNSWVTLTEDSIIGNKTRIKVFINHDLAVESGLNNTNQTIKINVTDKDFYSVDEKILSIEILTDTAPVWNLSKRYNFSFNEDNSSWGNINLSEYVSDDEGDEIVFYYFNDSEFSSFNSTTFNSSSGIINFTPVDGDVGFHNITLIASNTNLNSSTNYITFNISNINDNVSFFSLEVENGSIDNSSNPSQINLTEDNSSILTLWIEDDDFLIPENSIEQGYYNESFSLNLTILNSSGSSVELFEFSERGLIHPLKPNRTEFQAIFTPNKSHIGNYSVKLNVTDNSGSSDIWEFNMSISPIEHNPVLSNLSTQYSAINRNFYYDINATDLEDGTETLGNLNFSYENLSGKNIFNSTTFNSTTGVINITFNSSQGGKYNYRINVTDSNGDVDSKNFWIYVYDLPEINFPIEDYNFTGLKENESINLSFNVNHSVEDNLTYEFRIDTIIWERLAVENSSNTTLNFSYSNKSLRYNSTFYGNGTNFTWEFTPNFSDETYGKFKNISLTVYPSNSNLINATRINSTQTWKINISHENEPVSILDIGDKTSDYNKDITINLNNYLQDVDYFDEYYTQDIHFTVNHPAPTSISSSVSSGGILTLSSSLNTNENLNVTLKDINISNSSLYSSNITSNSFNIQFTTPETKEVPSSGGGSSPKPVILKLLFPGKLNLEKNKQISVPIQLKNNGNFRLRDITLNSSVIKEGVLQKEFNITFTENYFSSLSEDESENTTLIINHKGNNTGSFEIIINSSVENPEYSDWSKIYLEVVEVNVSEIMKRLIFTEEYLASNPECLEITEIIKRARENYDEGNYQKARELTQKALSACQETVSKPSSPKSGQLIKREYYDVYLLSFTIVLFAFGLLYYFYKRIKFKKMFK